MDISIRPRKERSIKHNHYFISTVFKGDKSFVKNWNKALYSLDDVTVEEENAVKKLSKDIRLLDWCEINRFRRRKNYIVVNSV